MAFGAIRTDDGTVGRRRAVGRLAITIINLFCINMATRTNRAVTAVRVMIIASQQSFKGVLAFALRRLSLAWMPAECRRTGCGCEIRTGIKEANRPCTLVSLVVGWLF